MQAAKALEHLVNARRCIGQGMEQLQPASVECIAACRELLEQAADQLRAVRGPLQGSATAVTEALRSEAGLLKLEIARMTKLVDGGAAFYRGLALRAGSVAPGYNAAGRTPEETTAVEFRGIAG
jgi:hypothetical protein